MIGATKNWLGGGFNGRIFDHITSVQNLFRAWKEFKKGKNKKTDIITFALNLENNIFSLRDELISGSWICGGYKKFSIKDPKPRIIHKAIVRDRLLYQAIYQVLYPIFDETFIFDSYSSRNGKGIHAGVKRLSVFLQKLSKNYTKPVYALKCDIKKFFDSIDHIVLLDLIKEKVDCQYTLKLIEKVISSFQKSPEKGLPLGNVTSQIFANVYMNNFDWYIKRNLDIKYYLRYNDDFVILSSDKNTLVHNIRYIVCYLNSNLKLSLHPDKILIRKLYQGIDFLGAVLLPHRIVIRTKTKKRILKKVFHTKDLQVIESYLGHISHTKSSKIRREILTKKRMLTLK